MDYRHDVIGMIDNGMRIVRFCDNAFDGIRSGYKKENQMNQKDKEALQAAFPGKDKELFNESGLTFAGELAEEVLRLRKKHEAGVRLHFRSLIQERELSRLRKQIVQ